MNTVLRKLRPKPLRTFLMLLQIVLGALAMTLALSAYLAAVQRQNAKQPDRFDLVAATQEENGVSGTYSLMNEGGVKEILELVPALEKIAWIGDGFSSSTVEKDGKLYQFQAVAYVNSDYFDLNQLTVTSGSLFTTKDAENKALVMLISDEAAKLLFGDFPAVGQTLNFVPDGSFVAYDDQGNELPSSPPVPFEIIGTFAEKQDYRFETLHGAFLPAWKKPAYSDGSVVNVLAKVGQGDKAREQILTAARDVFSTRISEWGLEKDEIFMIREIGEDIWNPQMNDSPDPTVVMFSIFGIVALIVGSIGIFSIMLVDALEREHDTGIKRVLGATSARITREMALEATLIAGLHKWAIHSFGTRTFTGTRSRHF
jgi:putative ABC transport system permease protein